MGSSFDVGVENRDPMNTREQLSSSHKSTNHNTSAYTKNRGFAKVLEEVAVNANQRPNVATCGPMKTCQEVSASHQKSENHKNTSVYTENCGRVKVFEDLAVNASQRHSVVTCGPVKTSNNQISVKNRSVSLKQTAAVANTTSSEVQQSTGGNETDSVCISSRLGREKNKDVQCQVVELCGELTAEELHNVYTRVFHRR